MGCILSISWGNRAQIYLCRHPLWRHFGVCLNIAQLHIWSYFKLIPMILTFLTLYSKLGCILSISWGNRAQICLCRHPIWRHLRVFFFGSRPTPYFVIFQTYSDDINFIVPPIWPYILERKFNVLLKTRVHFVNIVGE